MKLVELSDLIWKKSIFINENNINTFEYSNDSMKQLYSQRDYFLIIISRKMKF